MWPAPPNILIKLSKAENGVFQHAFKEDQDLSAQADAKQTENIT